MDADDLFCANCGTENPLADQAAKRLENVPSHYSFDCKSCGASMSYDASAQALRCPFCGSTRMQQREGVRTVKPSGIVPLQITRQQAESQLRDWLGSGFWRPGDAARAARIGEIAAVYVPYWVFEASAESDWTADSSPAPPGSRGDWYPVQGSHQATYQNRLIGASSVLTPRETESIGPFRLDAAVTLEQIDLTNVVVEEFRVSRKMARPMARGAIEQLEREACSKLVPNRSRNLRVNTLISSMQGRPMLLPVWILAYQYRQRIHRVLINGQTGQIAGSAPFSYGKLATILLVAGAILIALVILLAFAAAS